MKRCRHVISMDSIKHRCDVVADGHRGPTATGRGCMQWKTCAKCHAWLPLGPARDTPETAVEVRAAEIAVGVKESGCDPLVDASLSEMIGWRHHENGELPFHAPIPGMWCLDDHRVNPQRRNAELAGYLARCIAETGDSE